MKGVRKLEKASAGTTWPSLPNISAGNGMGYRFIGLEHGHLLETRVPQECQKRINLMEEQDGDPAPSGINPGS